MKRILLSRLNELFTALAGKEKLYIPAQDGSGNASFTLWREGLTLSNAGNTNRSAKDLFFPQVENLVGFQVSGKEIRMIETRDPAEPFVLFGVRACDARSFELLDRVFLADAKDTYYETRRQSATVVTLACSRPEATCFCGNFGIDPAEPGGDVSCWVEGEFLYWQANTEKGEALTQGLPLEDCDREPVETAKAAIRSVTEKLPMNHLDLSGFDRGNMLKIFHSDKWAGLSESCLGCGTCTFVCPTCQCYDIQEFNDGQTVRRFRCWDSCMYKDFTQMSAGQPRPTQKERFRQRFMHKLVYFPDNNDGLFGCVGCGRCLKRCPIHMNIVKVAKVLKEETV